MSAQVLERLVEETVALRRRVAHLETLEAAVHGQGARVYSTTAITLPSSTTASTISFNAERWDTDNCWSSGSPSRLTCNTPGIYVISAALQFAVNATGNRFVGIRLNGSTYIANDRRAAVANEGVVVAIATVYQLAAGDYVELRAAQTSGGNLDVVAVDNNSPEFAMVRVG